MNDIKILFHDYLIRGPQDVLLKFSSQCVQPFSRSVDLVFFERDEIRIKRDNKQLRLKFLYAGLGKWIVENFKGPFYGDVFYKNDLHLKFSDGSVIFNFLASKRIRVIWQNTVD